MYPPSRAMLCRMVSDSDDSPLEPASIEPLSASIEKVKAPRPSTEASTGWSYASRASETHLIPCLVLHSAGLFDFSRLKSSSAGLVWVVFSPGERYLVIAQWISMVHLFLIAAFRKMGWSIKCGIQLFARSSVSLKMTQER